MDTDIIDRLDGDDPRFARLRFADSYTRMGEVLALRYQMPVLDWYRILGHEWSMCDNIAEHLQQLRPALTVTRAALDAMMTRDERDAWKKLPARITVYRGCYGRNLHGLSWTLRPEVAAAFPFYGRYRSTSSPTAWLVTAEVQRRECVLKLDRDEMEIIAPSARIVSRRRLTPPAAVAAGA